MRVLLSQEAVESALDSMRSMLRADGYELDSRVDGSNVEVVVSATPDACEDCLVPKEMFAAMVADLLSREGIEVAAAGLTVTYPEER